MEILPLALFLVMLELTVGSFVSLFLLDLRGDSSRNFIVFQGVLYLVFALLTLLAMNAFATPEIVHGFGLDEPWLRAQGPLVLLFTLLMLPWNVLLWSDPQPRGKRARAAAPPTGVATADAIASQEEAATVAPDADVTPEATPPFAGGTQRAVRVGTSSHRGRRQLRFVVGALTALTGLAALFCVAMAYRALAESRLDGAFVVLAFVAGALALGGVMTAMLLGHWYLNTPTASGKPLEFVTTLLLAALAAELAFTIFIGPNTSRALTTPTTQTATATAVATATSAPATPAATPGGQTDPNASIPAQEHHQAPLGTTAMQVLQFLMGFIAPLILGGVALYLARGRSFQSATGMLYLCVAFIFMGEVLARGLLLLPGL